jgi:hypothetical protein
MKFNSAISRPRTQFIYSHAEQVTPAYIKDSVLAVAAITVIGAFSGSLIALLAALAIELTHPFQWSAAGGAAGGSLCLTVILDLFPRMIFTRQTIDNDAPDEPEPQSAPITKWVLPTGGNNFRQGEFNVSVDLLTDWCQAAYNEESLGFGKWVPVFNREFNTNGRQRFEEFRSEWLSRNLVYNAGGNQGLRLTDDGWEWVGGWLISQGRLQTSAPPTPPPAQLEEGQNRACGTHAHARTEGGNDGS